MDEWSRKVKIKFPDGREREMPLPQWNDEIQRRVEEAGGTFVLPEDPLDKPPPDITKFFMKSPQGQEEEESEAGVKELLLDIEESSLSDWELGFLETIKDWSGPLTLRQLSTATRIVTRHRRKR